MQLMLWVLVTYCRWWKSWVTTVFGCFKRQSATLHSCCLAGEWFAAYCTDLVTRCRILSNSWGKKTPVSDILLR